MSLEADSLRQQLAIDATTWISRLLASPYPLNSNRELPCQFPAIPCHRTRTPLPCHRLAVS